ncbi:hypothetical protein RchiOBHm_Chr7g0236001 [Rosa chinensis]|uniref:Uncharacterized protein n=1 Tax=Rosa chinensis TaxID=74649 RepID=A0A2P6PGV4_ROSCH|nr:hypothetical protein RchiOBHm_Chr7g0236001 [Rosa chinensis]
MAVYTIVNGDYFAADKTKAALKAFQHMIATGVAPASCTYTITFTALALHLSDVHFVGYAKYFYGNLGCSISQKQWTRCRCMMILRKA